MTVLHTFRLSDYDTPLPPSPSSRSGRYHVAGGPPAHYWSLHPHGPWAELLRSNGMRTPDDAAGLRKRLWVARFDVDPVPVTFDTAGSHDIAPADLVADDHAPCQQLAQRLVRGGVDAIIVPSAALPGVDNLVLFGPRVQADYGPEPVDPTVDVPAAVAADHARPQGELIEVVRHVGEPHAAHQAWVAGQPYGYPQPHAAMRHVA